MAIDWGAITRGYMTGGIPGAVGGYFTGKNQQKAEAAREEGLQVGMREQERIRQEQKLMRDQDLARLMQMFSPAAGALQRLYGIPMDSWGTDGMGRNIAQMARPPAAAQPGGPPLVPGGVPGPAPRPTQATGWGPPQQMPAPQPPPPPVQDMRRFFQGGASRR